VGGYVIAFRRCMPPGTPSDHRPSAGTGLEPIGGRHVDRRARSKCVVIWFRSVVGDPVGQVGVEARQDRLSVLGVECSPGTCKVGDDTEVDAIVSATESQSGSTTCRCRRRTPPVMTSGPVHIQWVALDQLDPVGRLLIS